MQTYASGEYPEVGDIVTKRGHKATRPATVLEVSEPFVTVRWGDSKGKMDYHVSDLVLVTARLTSPETGAGAPGRT